jgi:hypothetical protein
LARVKRPYKNKGFFLPNITAVIAEDQPDNFLSHTEGRAIPKANGESEMGQCEA